MTMEMVHIVDDSETVRACLSAILKSVGRPSKTYATAEQFLQAAPSLLLGCALVDINRPTADSLTIMDRLAELNPDLPVIAMANSGRLALAVNALKAGAADYLEKPFTPSVLLKSVDKTLHIQKHKEKRADNRRQAQMLIKRLTPREAEILQCLIQGLTTKAIAIQLDISPRTIDVHRAHLMAKLESKNIAAAIRTAVASGLLTTDDDPITSASERG